MNPLLLLIGLTGGLAFFSKGGDDSSERGLGKTTDPDPEEEEVVSAPVVKPTTPPKEPVSVTDPTPEAPEQPGSVPDSTGPDPVLADGTISIMAGRVATLSPQGDDIVSVRIVEGLEHGNVTVNPDNTLATVMTLSDFSGKQAFTYEVTHGDGSTTTHEVTLDVTPGALDGGWGTGSTHYMLATDENDHVIVEHGENHSKVYVSGSDSALSLSDIAAAEGLSVSQITGDWLLAHGGYGQSEDMALDQQAGEMLWHAATPLKSPSSNWLLLERGYEYGEFDRLIGWGMEGESAENPLYVGAWGNGADPDITGQVIIKNDSVSHLVFQGVDFSGGVTLLHAENVLFDDVSFTNLGLGVMRSDGITVRNSDFTDIFLEDSRTGGDWSTGEDRVQGLFANYTDGILLEGNFFDHNGYGYDWNYDGTSDGGQAPHMFNHNIYLGGDNTDVTMRDTITMRASSYGAQVRSGGFIEDVVFLDNNAGFTTYGGDYNGAGPIGNYTLMSDNLVTSGAHKVAYKIGALSLGIADYAEMTSLVGNIIAHLADPNNPDEIAEKFHTHDALKNDNTWYDDTMIWAWEGTNTIWNDSITESMYQNVDGLDGSVLDQTTIQIFTAKLLGKDTATIADLANYLRAQADGAFDDIVAADLIIRFFQQGFGVAPDLRTDAETLRFVPDQLGDGVRWDNRMNWSTDDLPGTIAGDSVDLGGNHVIFNANTSIENMEFGSGGRLEVHGGKLTVTGDMTVSEGEGELAIDGTGQVWAEGHDTGRLNIGVDGGRFVNTGDFDQASLVASGGQSVLATDGAEFDLSDGFRLSIFDAAAKVGFDGQSGGTAILDMHAGATLAYSAASGDLGMISEFRSGAMGDTPDVLSGIDLGGATLEIDLGGLSADAGNAFTLMDVDELVGLIDEATLSIGGLGARNAKIVIDYQADAVRLELTAGSGQVGVETIGLETDVDAGEQALWDALTADHGTMSESGAHPGFEDELEDMAA